MSCLRPDEIHDYLEGGLDASGARRVEAHAADCPACREALDARRRILQAALSLEPIAVPDGFAAGVMAHLNLVEEASLPRLSLRGWLAAIVAGSATFGATLIGLALLSGRNLGGTFSTCPTRFWDTSKAPPPPPSSWPNTPSFFSRSPGNSPAPCSRSSSAPRRSSDPRVQAACFVAALLFLAAGARALEAPPSYPGEPP